MRVCRRCSTNKISGHLGYLVGLTPRACWFYKNIENRQLWVRPMGGWKSTLQASWDVRHVYWARLCYVPFVIRCLWKTFTTWLLILSSTSFIVDRSRVFCMYSSWKRARSVTPLGNAEGQRDDFTRTMRSKTILRTDTMITRIEGGVRYAWYCYMLKESNKIAQKLLSI